MSSTAPFFAGLDFDRWRLFDTADLDEARECCARVFNPHHLRVVGTQQRLQARMDHARLGALSLNRLTWGAAVDVDPDRLGVYYLLSVPVRGQATFRHGGQVVELSPRQAGLVSAAPRFRFTADAGFEQVVLRLERSTIDQAWQALAGRPPAAPIDFTCALPMGGSVWQALDPALRLVAAGLRGEFDALGLAHLAARIEDQLVMALLLHQPHSLSCLATVPDAAAPRLQRRAEEWLLEHQDEPITLARAARACGVAARTLQASFQRSRGMGPMQWLREARLAAVRASLLSAAEARPSIAQTALRHGFTHLGEFGRAYRQRFDESPSQTLARRG